MSIHLDRFGHNGIDVGLDGAGRLRVLCIFIVWISAMKFEVNVLPNSFDFLLETDRLEQPSVMFVDGCYESFLDETTIGDASRDNRAKCLCGKGSKGDFKAAFGCRLYGVFKAFGDVLIATRSRERAFVIPIFCHSDEALPAESSHDDCMLIGIRDRLRNDAYSSTVDTSRTGGT